MPDNNPSIILATIHAGFHHSSLALTSIKASCFNEHYYNDIEILEFSHQSPITSKLEEITNYSPEIIGFSTYIWNIQETLHLCSLINKLSPKTFIVLGGPEAGPQGKELLSQHSYIDYVIQGEGEEAFKTLVNYIKEETGRKSNISGLYWRNEDGSIHANPVQIISPEKLISPFKLELHEENRHLVYWETSRGCPFQCSFCTSSLEKIRAFPLERVLEDLEALSLVKNKTIKLLDRSFHFNTERSLQVLKAIVQHIDKSNTIHLEINPDRMTKELFSFFQSCEQDQFQFEIGLQTLNESSLQQIKRKMDIPIALENIKNMVKMKKFHIHVDLIAGLPGDNLTSFIESLNCTFLLYADHLQLGTLKMLPGTPLRLNADRLGYQWDEAPPYEILYSRQFSYDNLIQIKYFSELLERLWNNELLNYTLIYLVETKFNDQISELFNGLLSDVKANAIANDRLQPELIFSLFLQYLQTHQWFQSDQVLQEILLLDYFKKFKYGSKMIPWIQACLTESTVILPEAGKQKMPVIHISEEAAYFINKTSLFAFMKGRYIVRIKSYIKGNPVSFIPYKKHLEEQ